MKNDRKISYLKQSLQQAEETLQMALESRDPFRIAQTMGQVNDIEKSLLEEESRQRMHEMHHKIEVDWNSEENLQIEDKRKYWLKEIERIKRGNISLSNQFKD